MSDVEFRIPDEVTPRRALRVFHATQPRRVRGDQDPLAETWIPRRDSWELCPVGGPHPSRWSWSRVTTAGCGHGRGHAAPDMDCGCGLWSVKTLRDLLSAFQYGLQSKEDAVTVIGVVQIYGRVIEHEHGYRSEKAGIERLWVIPGIPCTAPRLEYTWILNPFGPKFPPCIDGVVSDLRREYGAPVERSGWDEVRDWAQAEGLLGDEEPDPMATSAIQELLSAESPRPSLLRCAVVANLASAALNLSLLGWRLM